MLQKTQRLRFAFLTTIKLTRVATAETTVTMTTTTTATTRTSAAEAFDPQGCRDRLSRPKHFSMKGPRGTKKLQSQAHFGRVLMAESRSSSSACHIASSLKAVVLLGRTFRVTAERWRPIRSSPLPRQPAHTNDNTPSWGEGIIKLNQQGCQVRL